MTTLFSACSADAQRWQAVQWTGWPRRRQDPGRPRDAAQRQPATACAGLSRWPVSLGLDGVGLGTVWGEQVATRMLREAGFTDVAIHTVEGDAFNNYYVARSMALS
ncbi:MAG TPA: hypothetical protein VK390_01485 [Propionibacteriaceae bacterium]|nr:hypothetical protein [Propionibacteriaceae bacterium]